MLPSSAWPQARKPSTIAEFAGYLGADREQLLYTGAKSEGKIIWYTSLAGDSYKEMVKAFESKYPGVKVESFRASGSELIIRFEEETKAGRNIADAIETTEGSLIFLRDGKLLRPYNSPQLNAILKTAKSVPTKISYYWALARESYIGFAYNKTFGAKEACQKNFDVLLHPQLKGKMGISIGQTSDKIIGAMIKTKGEEFVRKLKGAGDQALLHRRARTGEHHHVRRDRRVAGNLSDPYAARRIEGRAGGMGADGFRADQRRQRRHRRQPAPSPCGTFDGGFSLEPGRPRHFEKYYYGSGAKD